MFYSFGRFLILLTRQIHIVSIVSDSKFLPFFLLYEIGFIGLIIDDMFLTHTDGSSGSDRNNSEAEIKPKQKPIPRKEAPPRPSPPASAAPQNV